MAPTGKAYQTDWLLSPTSNVHIASHRGWFTTFTEFHGPLDTIYLGPGSGGEIFGVGDVELQITKALDQGKTFCKKVVLHDVLYVPTFVANIFGQLAGTGYLTDGMTKRKLVDRETGCTIGEVDEKARMPRLWLKKQRLGRSSLDPQGFYCINVWWSDEERIRFQSHQSDLISTPVSSYSPEEKAWLKKHHRGEHRFLRKHKLSIYNEDDREGGKGIVKALMAQDAANGEAGD